MRWWTRYATCALSTLSHSIADRLLQRILSGTATVITIYYWSSISQRHQATATFGGQTWGWVAFRLVTGHREAGEEAARDKLAGISSSPQGVSVHRNLLRQRGAGSLKERTILRRVFSRTLCHLSSVSKLDSQARSTVGGPWFCLALCAHWLLLLVTSTSVPLWTWDRGASQICALKRGRYDQHQTTSPRVGPEITVWMLTLLAWCIQTKKFSMCGTRHRTSRPKRIWTGKLIGRWEPATPSKESYHHEGTPATCSGTSSTSD